MRKQYLRLAVPLATALFLVGCEAEKPQQEATPEKTIVLEVHQNQINTIASYPAVVEAFEHIVQQREKNLNDLIELTEIPAPPFGEAARAARFAEMLSEAGISDITIDEVGNVIARRQGTVGDKVIALGAHLDTVFPEGTDVKVRVDGDTLYAPGIGDNTRGLVFLLSLIRAMEATNISTRDDVLFIGTVGEEGLGDLRGVKHLFREGGPQIDSFIGVDGGDNARLIYGAVGSHRYRVIVSGPGGHSWGAFGLANPHHALGRIMQDFATTGPSVTSKGPKTSFSVGRIGGGTSVNSIPFESWMEVDMRSGNQAKLDEIDTVFRMSVKRGLAAENAARLEGPALEVELKQVGDRPAGLGDINGGIVQRAVAAMKVLNIDAQLSSSSTDASIPISMGLPAVTISRGGEVKKSHSPDESWRDHDSHKSIQYGLLLLLAEAGLVTGSP